MGQAKRRGTYEERKAAAIQASAATLVVSRAADSPVPDAIRRWQKRQIEAALARRRRSR
jgi:hypothetical protein